MTDAGGYIRLSQDGKSLERQQRDVEEYSAAENLDIVAVYNEGKGESGYDTNRTEYKEMMADIEEGKIEAVVVPNLSRLSRDRKQRLRLILDLDTAGVQLHSVELGRDIDLDNDWELVQQSIKATTDDVEKRKEIERSKRATKERLENGFDHGRPPFGLTFDDAGEYWVPGEDYEDVLDILRLRERGHTYAEISDEVDVASSTAARVVSRKKLYHRRGHQES